jgi:hypothetical protein
MVHRNVGFSPNNAALSLEDRTLNIYKITPPYGNVKIQQEIICLNECFV